MLTISNTTKTLILITAALVELLVTIGLAHVLDIELTWRLGAFVVLLSILSHFVRALHKKLGVTGQLEVKP